MDTKWTIKQRRDDAAKAYRRWMLSLTKEMRDNANKELEIYGIKPLGQLDSVGLIYFSLTTIN